MTRHYEYFLVSRDLVDDVVSSLIQWSMGFHHRHMRRYIVFWEEYKERRMKCNTCKTHYLEKEVAKPWKRKRKVCRCSKS